MAANSTSTYIAQDLVEDILLRLPFKSILRFKSVSRQWKSSLESQSFIERHLKSSRRKILLALDSDGDPPSLFLPGEEKEGICYIRNCDASRKSLTCDGLICIPRSDSIEVCNPATRESRRFPLGEPLVSTKRPTGSRIPIISIVLKRRIEELVSKFPSEVGSFGFGKDEVTGAYKVVELRSNGIDLIVEDCTVLDLDTGQWRRVGFVPYRIFTTERSVYVNGSVHWFTIDLWEPNVPRIVAFDLGTEEFRVVSYPNFYLDLDSPNLSSELLSLGQNRLLVSEMRRTPDARLDIWSMVDVEEERWAKMYSVILCHLYQPERFHFQLFTPVAISEQGDRVVIIVWDYRETLFKSSPDRLCSHKLYSEDARVVASSYIPSLVRVPQHLT